LIFVTARWWNIGMHKQHSKKTLVGIAVMAAFAVVLTLTNIASAWALMPDVARSDDARAEAPQ